ncbi:hypothetical protein QTO34_008648 [Cnephaeus nilssonii]|uniref:Uncharacterized protein n=1 Tax=Cnephaeus nilssonii TaxID=3371016 RepID=A0AA40HH86_CNENI|nr:hypothetical protein QTO34_008648 [Eptesicus nilssonii]
MAKAASQQEKGPRSPDRPPPDAAHLSRLPGTGLQPLQPRDQPAPGVPVPLLGLLSLRGCSSRLCLIATIHPLLQAWPVRTGRHLALAP